MVEDSVLCMQSTEDVFGSTVFSFVIYKKIGHVIQHDIDIFIVEVTALQHHLPTILPCLKILQLFFMLFSVFFSFFVKAMDMLARQTTKLTNKAQAKITFQLLFLSNNLPLYGYTFSVTC